MKKMLVMTLVLMLLAPLAWSDSEPRTGYFRKSYTPLELLGPEGANAISSVIAPDEKMTWQLSVPKTYDPSKPAGAMVHTGWSDSWGGGKKAWVATYEERNLIWIGVIGGGDKKPVNERMLKALLAKAVLDKDYKIDPDRYYLYGTSGGAHIAAMLATTKPELFKGAIYYAAALSWGKNTPQKIEQIRQNRYIFMAGALDDDKNDIKRAADDYIRSGVENTRFISIANTVRKTPGVSYFDDAVQFLDGQVASEESSE